MQEIAFQIIAAVGAAKSLYIEAIYLSREGKFEEARSKIAQGDKAREKSHYLHLDLVQKEADGEQLPFSLLLMHAEDQMLNAETIKLMAEEIIELRQESSRY